MHRISRALRLRSDYFSITHNQTDLTKRICLIRGSKVSRRGHTVAASVVSDDTKVKKEKKRVPKVERQAMVESYIIKYKAMNNGKIPSISDTQKQVGGNYYIIKNILQEMEHRSKTLAINTMHKNALRKEAIDVNKAPADVPEVSVGHLKRKTFSKKVTEPNKKVDGDDVNPDYSDVKKVNAAEAPKASTPLRKALTEEVVKPKSTVQGDSSSYIANQAHVSEVESVEVVVHLHSEKRDHDVKEILPSEGPHLHKQQHKPSSESDKLAMGNSERQANNEELPKQQPMWGLKSLVVGIMKLWRGP